MYIDGLILCHSQTLHKTDLWNLILGAIIEAATIAVKGSNYNGEWTILTIVILQYKAVNMIHWLIYSYLILTDMVAKYIHKYAYYILDNITKYTISTEENIYYSVIIII